MKSFTIKLEGPVGCGKDTFMDLVAERLKDEYVITRKEFSNIINIPEAISDHEWEVHKSKDYNMYSEISIVTGLSRSDVKKVIQAFTYSIEHD